jgi:hypothetical protein
MRHGRRRATGETTMINTTMPPEAVIRALMKRVA